MSWFKRRSGTTTARSEDPKIGLTPDPAAPHDALVISIMSIGTDQDRELKDERETFRLLSQLSPGSVRRLDSEMRRWRSSWYGHPWYSMQPTEALSIIEGSSDRAVIAVGLSMHSNGYIREIAARALAAGDEWVLPWLVLRAGDSVAEVRNVAIPAVNRYLVVEKAHALVKVLPLFEGGRFRPAQTGSHLRDRVESVLGLVGSTSALRSGVSSSDRLTRRAAVRLALCQDVSVDLLAQVIHTNDVVSIGLVASALPNDGPSNIQAGSLLYRSPVARFRSYGLWRLTRDATTNSRNLAYEGLVDRAQSVRDVAQRWLTTHEPKADVNDFYRSRLEHDPLSALRGLGDAGFEQDAKVAVDHLNSEVSAIRVAALRLLARLERQSDSELFVERFLRGSAKERQVALAGLQRVGSNTTIWALWQSLPEDSDPTVLKRVLFQLVPMTDRWRRISIGLQASARTEPGVADAGIDVLHRTLNGWNRGYPTKPTIEPGILREQFEKARPSLRVNGQRRYRPNLERQVENILTVSD